MKKQLRIAMFGHKRIPSREGGIEIVVEELCIRMVRDSNQVTCYNRAGHHVSGSEYDTGKRSVYKGIRLKSVPTIEKKGLAAVSASFFASLCCAFGKYDVVHIHAEGPAFFTWLPKMFRKRVIVTVHGIDWQRAKWKSGYGSKFIHQGEKNAVKYADEIIVL
ncbi:MAG: glycosyltransferase, partial [Coprococcus comes]|nr:glycosyltransferase [Coprococcus comes]